MSKPLKFYLLTDTHYYSQENGRFTGLDQVCLNECDQIIDAVFKKIAADNETDIVLIAGDLTDHGERNEHEGFLKKLPILKNAGKRVFVITGTHDYGLRLLDETYTRENVPESKVMRDDLRELYYDYGRNEAIAEHLPSMSYAVQLSDGCRLLCLNDDGNGRSFCGYNEDELSWILEQIAKAKADGQFIFAMTHHPTLPPSPIYPLFSLRDMLGDYENCTTALADAGLKFIFTGHTHMLSITSKTTDKGNTLYDINTGSVIGYPAPYRHCVLDGETLSVETRFVEEIDMDLGGKDLKTHMRDTFDKMLTSVFDNAAYDFEALCGMAGSFSMSGDDLRKFKLPITFIGKRLQKLTFGKLGRLLLCSKKIHPAVKNTSVKNTLIECVRNVWTGNEPYGLDTPIGSTLYAIARRLQPIAGRFSDKSPLLEDTAGFLLSLIYDGGIDDWNATLK